MIVILAWAASISIVKYAVGIGDAYAFNLARLVPASLVLLFAVSRTPALRKFEWRDAGRVFVLGVAGHVVFQVGLIHGTDASSATSSAMILALTPVAIAILAWVTRVERFCLHTAAGLVLHHGRDRVRLRSRTRSERLPRQPRDLRRDARLVGLHRQGSVAGPQVRGPAGHGVDFGGRFGSSAAAESLPADPRGLPAGAGGVVVRRTRFRNRRHQPGEHALGVRGRPGRGRYSPASTRMSFPSPRSCSRGCGSENPSRQPGSRGSSSSSRASPWLASTRRGEVEFRTG